ncbi:MAG: mycofactocin biosynthesis glycosyltransferase MftF [candidate division WOR-3 bacterium]
MDCRNQIVHFKEKGDLEFRLRKGNRVIEADNSIFIVTNFPFKITVIRDELKSLFSNIFISGYLNLSELQELYSPSVLKDVCRFLFTLVRKGVLETRGRYEKTLLKEIDVIIAVRNREKDIKQCLESILNLNYPYELLTITVVDDCSTDRTKNIVRSFGVNLIELSEQVGISKCRNLGVSRTNNEIIAFIDSDCVAHEDWLSDLVPAFDDPDLAAVGGKVKSYYLDKKLDRYEAVMSPLDVSNRWKRSSEEDPSFYIPSCNLLIRRSVFCAIGGFDESFNVGEDVDLCYRLRQKGYIFEFRPEGVVYHKHRNRFISFALRRMDYGTSEPILTLRHHHINKRLHLPILDLLFISFITLAGMTLELKMVTIAICLMLTAIIYEYTKLRRFHIPYLLVTIIKHRLRSPFVWAHSLFSFYSRYYLLIGGLIALSDPIYFLTALTPHVLVCLTQYIIRKPKLGFPIFLYFFTTEQIFYQIGVWYYCFKCRTLKPVNPILMLRLLC